MPKDPAEFNQAIALYRKEIGTEAYQPLETLLSKIKNIWTSNSTKSSILPSSQPELALKA